MYGTFNRVYRVRGIRFEALFWPSQHSKLVFWPILSCLSKHFIHKEFTGLVWMKISVFLFVDIIISGVIEFEFFMCLILFFFSCFKNFLLNSWRTLRIQLCAAIFISVGSLRNEARYIFMNHDNVQSVKNCFVRAVFLVMLHFVVPKELYLFYVSQNTTLLYLLMLLNIYASLNQTHLYCLHILWQSLI